MSLFDTIDGRLKDKVKTLTDEEWDAIGRVAYSMCLQNHGLSFRIAEANAMLAIINEKDHQTTSSKLN